ncbi:MAG: SLC45 family MFS transporter [Anaerolineae bacterium]|jgi:MFS family permease|nr:SLC45 family MFS transporter [Anaerolineae bacterium]
MTERPFPWTRTFILGFGFFGISIIWPLFNSLVPPMLEDLGLSAFWTGFILTWDNIINMLLQPVIGAKSDRTRSRFGRRKPFLMLGAPLAAAFFILVPFVRENFVLIALAILGTNLAMALFRSPTIAFLGDLFRPAERSKANGVINLMGGVGGAVALFAGGALYAVGVPAPFIVGALVMLIAIAVVVLFVRDDPTAGEGAAPPEASPGLRASLREVATDRNRSGVFLLAAIFSWFVGWNATEAFFTLYARNVLGMEVGAATQMLTVFAAALILFAIPSGLIATRFGRKPTIIVGLAGMAVGVIVATLVRNATVLLAVLGVMGAFWALVNINSLPMVYDLAKSGSIGAYTGLYYFASSLAAIVGPTVAGGLIDLTSHRVIWPFTAVFLLLAIVFMSRVRPQPPAAG